MRNLLFLLLFLFCIGSTPGCKEEYTPPLVITDASYDFSFAKALIELTYITEDKELVKQFRDDYIRDNRDGKYAELYKWAGNRPKEFTLLVIDEYMVLEFKGK